MNVTTLIPVFNTESHHLVETVQAVVNQVKGARIVIVDDGSTSPDTKLGLEICKLYSQVHVHSLSENRGTPTALNEGHSIIDTEFVALAGSSDIWLPSKFNQQMEYLKKHPETDVLGTGLVAFRNSDPWRTKWFSFVHPEKPVPGYMPKQHKYFITNHGTTIYRKSAVEAVGGYNPKFLRGQDVQLWERMHKAGSVFRNIPKVLCLWRR